MRFDAPSSLNRRLHVLASQLAVPVRDLLLDGIHLALRYHGDGHGIPQPPIRTPPSEHAAGEIEVVEDPPVRKDDLP